MSAKSVLTWAFNWLAKGGIVLVKRANGTMRGRCPRCKGRIVFAKFELGKPAFTCDTCGERGTWKAPE